MDTDTHRWETVLGVPEGRRDGSGGFQPAVKAPEATRHVVTPDPRHLRFSCAIILLCSLVLILTGCRSTSTSSKTSPVISITYEFAFVYTDIQKSDQRIVPGYDLFTNGKCLLRTSESNEITFNLSPEEVADLVSFCRKQGFFSISNESLEKAIPPMTFRWVTNELSDSTTTIEFIVSDPKNPALEKHGDLVTVTIQDGTVKNSISRYNLHKETKHYTNLPQFQIIGRCMSKIDETVMKTWEKQRAR
jgi:hypothetical protein